MTQTGFSNTVWVIFGPCSVKCSLGCCFYDRLTATVFSFLAPESHRAVRTIQTGTCNAVRLTVLTLFPITL